LQHNLSPVLNKLRNDKIDIPRQTYENFYIQNS
jgi:hypothetical protein